MTPSSRSSTTAAATHIRLTSRSLHCRPGMADQEIVNRGRPPARSAFHWRVACCHHVPSPGGAPGASKMLDLQEGLLFFSRMPPEASARCCQERRGGADLADHVAGPGRLHPSDDARQASAHSTWRDRRRLHLQELFPSFGRRRGPTKELFPSFGRQWGPITTNDDYHVAIVWIGQIS